jgi:poly(hydroxyalkanoate) depolymerase family esterase
MHPDFQRLMSEATRLTRDGDLNAAMAAIQSALDHGARPAAGGGHVARPLPAIETPWTIDVEAREVLREDEPLVPPAPAHERSRDGRFIAGFHGDGTSRRDYKLYIPPAAGDEPLPLIVMLHGCTQNPDDFAAGTAMNEAAESQGFFVLYPAQSPKANPQRCWNWFKHTHQQRGRGEPAMLAGITREVMARHSIDPRRVYVAGLSAGGAMAAILGDTYPDLFAAVGVHSGLAAGTASDLPSALQAMKGASPGPRERATGVPTIVFHGDADATVHAGNALHVVAASAGDASAVDHQHHEGAGRRAFTRRVHRNADGRVVAEHWLVHGAAHAWSGGRPHGSYTDGRGPDATAEMVRFFLEHPRAG